MTINIIGAGNVAYHLTKALLYKQLPLQQLYNRSAFSTDFDCFAVEKTHCLSELKPATLTIIATSDNAIASLSEQLPFSGGLVVHTSGNTPLTALHPKNRRGVFYPLQSFSKHTEVDFSKVPICLEAENTDDLVLLQQLASHLSTHCYQLSSAQRQLLHVAAVFANNFTNHLIAISQEICEQHHIPFELLQPLIAETFAKLQHHTALEAQTGPARRGDTRTITAHLALLNEPQKQLYEYLTKSIINTYGKKVL